jgi:hypothetical protein
MSLMNPSPSGFIDAPAPGKKCPNSTPAAMPASTYRYRFVDRGALCIVFLARPK